MGEVAESLNSISYKVQYYNYNMSRFLLAILMVAGLCIPQKAIAHELDSAGVGEYIYEIYLEMMTAEFDDVEINHLLAEHKDLLSPAQLSWAYNVRGQLYFMDAEYDSALHYFTDARDVFDLSEDSSLYYHAAASIATVYIAQGRFQEAAIELYAAKKFWEATDNLQGLSSVNFDLSVIYATRDEWELSEFYLNKYVENAAELDNRQMLVVAYNNLAVLDLNRDNPQAAKEKAMQAIQIHHEIGVPPHITGYIYSTLGEICRHEGKYDLARQYADSCKQQALMAGEDLAIIHNIVLLAKIEHDLGNYESAWANLDSSFAIANEINDQGGLKFLLRTATQWAREEKDWQSVYRYQDSLLHIDQNSVSSDIQVMALIHQLENQRSVARYSEKSLKVERISEGRRVAILLSLCVIVISIMLAWVIQYRIIQRLKKYRIQLSKRQAAQIT